MNYWSFEVHAYVLNYSKIMFKTEFNTDKNKLYWSANNETTFLKIYPVPDKHGTRLLLYLVYYKLY